MKQHNGIGRPQKDSLKCVQIGCINSFLASVTTDLCKCNAIGHPEHTAILKIS